MKILHIWSCAGVSSLIAKTMDHRHGTHSDVLITEKWDTLGLNEYNTIRIKFKPMFGLRSLVNARKYDIIHVHYHSIFIPFLARLYPNKPIIMHFHGSDVRENWGARLKRIEHADQILVSSSDLLVGAPEDVIWCPNPVDILHFSPMPGLEYEKERAMTFSYGADLEALRLANALDVDLDFISGNIPHREVPALMARYSHYIDVKRDFRDRLLYDGDTLSIAGLEALAMGLKVISKDSNIREGLPTVHRPDYVADSLHKLYGELKEEKE